MGLAFEQRDSFEVFGGQSETEKDQRLPLQQLQHRYRGVKVSPGEVISYAYSYIGLFSGQCRYTSVIASLIYQSEWYIILKCSSN